MATQVLQQIIGNAVNTIVSTVVDFYQRGARNILIFNSTDLGLLPAAGPPDRPQSQAYGLDETLVIMRSGPLLMFQLKTSGDSLVQLTVAKVTLT